MNQQEFRDFVDVLYYPRQHRRITMSHVQPYCKRLIPYEQGLCKIFTDQMGLIGTPKIVEISNHGVTIHLFNHDTDKWYQYTTLEN